MPALRPRLLVELGTHNGVSYAAFCDAVARLKLDTRCFAVDTWQGDEHAGHYGEDVFSDLQPIHDANYAAYSELVRSHLRPGPARISPTAPSTCCTSTAATPTRPCATTTTTGARSCPPRAVVLFHDTNVRERQLRRVAAVGGAEPGAWPGFEFMHEHGLGVLCVGAQVPPAVLALARLDPQEAGRARALFAALGARWETAFMAGHHERGVALRDDRIRTLEAHVGNLERHVRTEDGLSQALRAKAARTAAALEQAQAEAAAAIVAASEASSLAEERVAALAEARARILELREKVAPLRNEHAARVAAEGAVLSLRTERDVLLASTSWRLTAPLRRVTRRTPPNLRRLARRLARLAWWAATPWRIPLRLRYRRQVIAHWQAEALRQPPPPPAGDDEVYERWMAAFEPALFVQIGEDKRPPVSILLPTAGVDDRTAATVDSLLRQTEADWTLVVPDLPEARAATAVLGADRRLVFAACPPEAERGGVLDALLAAAPDPWVLVLDSGDVLPPAALKWLSMAVTSEPGAAAAYADEDLLGPGNRRMAPQFKPDWSPELLTAYNYLGRPTLLSRDLARSCGGFRRGRGAGAEWDLNLRLAAAAAAAHRPIRRLPAVLCHRPADTDRERPAPGTQSAGEHRAVLQSWWEAQGHRGVVVRTEPDGTARATWTIADPPLVSVVIPNRNSPGLLRRCLKGLLERTAYRNLEVVIVENNSDDPETLAMYGELERLPRVKVVARPGPFNYSAACNHGARHATGPLLLFLNNDIEVQEPGWLDELVRVASRPGVGVVGTKLLYPDGTLQHAGVAAGPHLLGLMFHRAPNEGRWGVFGSPDTLRNWSAIMGACQMVRREAFDQVGGFDEVFELANSDIILCLRAGQLGYRTAYAPHAALVHHEGTTRGRENPAEDMARSARELRRLGLEADPFFHPGLSGNNPVPTLRAPGDPSGEQALQALSERFLAAAPVHGPGLDLFDDAAVLRAADLPRAHVLPAPFAGGTVADEWDAARWVITLLRSRPDLRMRFPRALADGPAGAFARWLRAGTEREMPLPPGLDTWLEPMWAAAMARRPRQVYFWRDDVHWGHPVGLLPPGYAAYLRYLFRDGQFEYRLRLEEAWWFLLSSAEDPAAELVRAWRFNMQWQELHPLGLTVFGAAAFAAWFAERYGLDSATAWLDPARWPNLPDAADQLRLAYARQPAWQARHPGALDTAPAAASLLDWLAGPDGGQAQAVRDWCRTQREAGLDAALAGLAVNVLGHFCYPSGLRVSAEAIADAMDGAGVAVSRRDIRTHLNDDPPHTSVGGLESADVTIVHTQPGDLFLKAYDRADLFPRAPRTHRIGYWYWELDEAPAEWGAIAAHADEIWTATDFVAGALRKVVDVPVHVMFPGVRITAFTPIPRERLGAPARGEEGRFAFLFSFHMASITERKNPMALVRAFRQAFSPEEKVDLVLKTTSEARHAAELAELRAAVGGHNVTVIDAVFTPEETLALMDGCDAYVSLHRAEGLGLGMAEAMLLGKPVIASRYSGNLQFMDDDNSLLVDCTVRTIGRAIKPYEATARWAEPSIEHAARLMRQLFDDQDAARALGRRAQESARATMSLEVAGRRMAARLAAIRAAAGRPPAA